MTYKEARVYLDDRSRYGSVLGLDSIRGLLRELDNPQKDLKFIHIAGTNGKGSVLAYTSSILSEAGYRTGRYVSPTVVSYLEKIQIDGEWISEEMFAEETAKVRDAIVRLEKAGKPVPTVFEAETAIAFLYFRDMKCDFVVLEAGLGGALDATNVIENTICAVFSSIGRDHIGVIGDSVEEIAENKAGIMKPGCVVVSAFQKPEVETVLRKCAARVNGGCKVFFVCPRQAEIERQDLFGMTLSYKMFAGLQTVLTGEYQKENLLTALETVLALRSCGYYIPDDAVRNGTAAARWPGRFEKIGEHPFFILDGAHNEDAALRLKETVCQYFSGKKLIFIMGVFADKEYEKISRIMCPLSSSVYTAELPDKKRGLPAEKLADTVEKYCPKVKAFPAGNSRESIEQAVDAALSEAAPEDVILAFGSLSYLQIVRETYAGHN